MHPVVGRARPFGVAGQRQPVATAPRAEAQWPSFQPCLHRYRHDLRAKKELVFNGLGPLVGMDAKELLGLVAMYREAAHLRERRSLAG